MLSESAVEDELKAVTSRLEEIEAQLADAYLTLAECGVLREWSKENLAHGIKILNQMWVNKETELRRLLTLRQNLCLETLQGLRKLTVTGDLLLYDRILRKLEFCASEGRAESGDESTKDKDA